MASFPFRVQERVDRLEGDIPRGLGQLVRSLCSERYAPVWRLSPPHSGAYPEAGTRIRVLRLRASSVAARLEFATAAARARRPDGAPAAVDPGLGPSERPLGDEAPGDWALDFYPGRVTLN